MNVYVIYSTSREDPSFDNMHINSIFGNYHRAKAEWENLSANDPDNVYKLTSAWFEKN